jgi:predicted RNase H-like HicB family nuclease
MYRYDMVIGWSAEDQLFIARVPELPGCMAHGATPEMAAREAQVAIGLWVDTAAEDGIPIPEPKAKEAVSSPAAPSR